MGPHLRQRGRVAAVTLALALLMLFFIYRDGDKFIEQVATISDLMCNACSKKARIPSASMLFQSKLERPSHVTPMKD
jgi:hypothetical protein